MATKYISPTGNDSTGDGSQGNPWATPYKADQSATAGDTINVAAGTYTADGTAAYGTNTYHAFTKGLLWVAATNGAVFFRNTGTTNPVGFISGSLLNAAVMSFTGIVFDAQSATQYAFSNGDMAGRSWTVTWTSCEFKNATIRGMLIDYLKIGSFTTVDCIFSGSPSSAGLDHTGTGANIGASGTVTVLHTRPVLNLTSTGTIIGINQTLAAAPAGTFNFTVDGATGTVETTSVGSNFAIGIYASTSAAIIKNSNNLIAKAPAGNSGETICILVKGLSVAVPCTAPIITGNSCYCDVSSGFGIQVGTGTVDTFTTAAIVKGNYVRGNYYSATYTPHAYSIGMNCTATVTGNTAENTYVGILMSKTTSGTVSGNIAKDCYGAAFYAKGTTAATFTGNTAIYSGKNAIRALGAFAVTYQGSTDCTAVTFSNNVAIFARDSVLASGPFASISGLAADSTTAQTCTFTNNTYQVSKSFAITGNQFQYKGVQVAAPNVSYTTWLVTETTDQIVQLPAAALNAVSGGLGSGRMVYLPGKGMAVAA